MKLPILKYDNPVLRRRALPIAEITPQIIQLAHDMIETMSASNGVGLAAVQVGHLVRMFVLRDELEDSDEDDAFAAPEVFINPHLSKPSEEKEESLEGCLSLPHLQLEIMRPQSISIRYQNLKGEWIEERLENLRARIAMHENDHLNGTLIIDRIDRKKRSQIEPRLRKIAAGRTYTKTT